MRALGRHARRGGTSYHHGDLRRALLDATLSLAAEVGTAGVTLRQAANRAGVSQTAPYRHFDDKAAMLAAASEEGFRLLHARMTEAARPFAAEPMRRLGAWGGFATSTLRSFTRPTSASCSAGKPRGTVQAAEALQAAARNTIQLLLQTVESGARTARLRAADTRELALKIWSLAHGIAVLAIDGQTVFLGVQPERAGSIAEGLTALLAGYASP